ncbi:MAG TPA: DUF4062 domain-containing protein [Phototrophicaceae bacterium]|jgi:hypothetical protein|nr:DUF4062 domain-containing protein [Phototrophicaceae bacterium]
MTTPVWKVYVSSTGTELQPYRIAVLDAIVRMGFLPIMFDPQTHHTDDLMATIQRQIDDCVLFIGIYAHQPGNPVLGTHTPLIEAEYQYATQRNIQTLVYVVNPEIPWSAQAIARGEAGKHIEAFKHQLFSTGKTELFDSPQDLQARVFFGLHHAENLLKWASGTMDMQPIFGPPSNDQQFITDIFMITPFAGEFNSIYHEAIVPVVEKLGYTIRRGDDFYSRHSIINEIWSAIYHSKFVIAEATGRNANVAYELGIAHTLGKLGILITQNLSDIPFDLQHLRIIVYPPDDLGSLRSQLQHSIEWLMMHPER